MTHEHLPEPFSAKIRGTKSGMLLARCFYCSIGMSLRSDETIPKLLSRGDIVEKNLF